jgi:hypothetical protein
MKIASQNPEVGIEVMKRHENARKEAMCNE